MNVRNVLLGIAAIFLCVITVYWFNQTYELVETEEYTGYRGEARSNTLFAARVFLKRMGVPAEKKDLLTQLPDTQSVLVLNNNRYSISRDKADAILDWVKRGGHLIMRARSLEYGGEWEESTAEKSTTGDAEPLESKRINPDKLESTLGIKVERQAYIDTDKEALTLKLPNMPKALPLDAGYLAPISTTQPNAVQYKYLKRTWLIEQPYGAGKVTFTGNLDFIENLNLADSEHARIFWYLIHSHHAHPKYVWLMHSTDMPPLWKLLWTHAWALVITLSLFIPLIIWALSPRFGAIQPVPSVHRRRILEHIYASGRFMWERHHKHNDQQYQEFAAQVQQQSIPSRTTHDK